MQIVPTTIPDVLILEPNRFTVHEQHIVCRAGVGGVFANGYTQACT
jgi:hypothetical protein